MTAYRELDYLESTGTQYIDTLWHPQSNNLRVKFKAKSNGNPNKTAICGAENSSVVPRWVFVMYGQDADTTKTFPLIGDWKNGGAGFTPEGFTFTDGTTLEIDWTANATSTTVTDSVSGTAYTHTFGATINYLNNTTTLKLFQNGDTQRSSIDMYYYQIYDNNVLVRDFIPVLDFNNTPCMYDKVSNTYYYNQGSGDFGYSIKGYYTELEYIESTGTQYIDTGVCLSNNHSVEISFQMTVTGQKRTGIFGGLCNANTVSSESDYGRYGMLTHYNNAYYEAGYGKTNVVQNVGTPNLNKCLFYQNKNKLYMNGTLVKTFSAATFRMGLSAYLGGFRYTSYTPSKAKYYYAKFWDGDTLVRDLIPVLDWNMKPCMYDKVTGAKFYNEGTGEFKYGVLSTPSSIQLRRKFNTLLASYKKDYTLLKYLESTGTQYIDTGITGDENTKWVVTAALLGSQDTRVYMGQTYNYARNPVNNRFAFGYNEDGWYCGMGDKNVSRIAASNTNSHVFVLDAPNKKFYVDNNSYDIGWTTFSQPSTIVGGIGLFGRLCADTGEVIPFINARLFSTQIYKNNVLVMDLKPILDKNGTPCMWDRVNDKLYYNKGTGDFSYKEWDYTPCDYVYADGNAYTSTMLYGNSDTKMEMVFDIPTQSTQNRGVMGSRGSSANNQLLAIGYGTSTAASDFNNSSYSTYRASIVYDLNKKYRVYTSKEKRSIVDESTGTVLDENNTLCSDTMSTGALLLGAETGLNYRHVGNIYGAKIWDGATLIRDYIPVVDGDNRAGLYDSCLNTIFYSVGSSDFEGHFVDGNNVDYKVVSYLESQASNTASGPYIDTGVNYFADFELTSKQRTSSSMKGCGVDQMHCVERENATTNCWRFRSDESVFFTTSLLVTDKHSLKWKQNKVYGDGVFLGDFTKPFVEKSFLVFGINATGTNPVNRYSLLVWKLKIWDTDTRELIRNLVPVLKNTEAGMYDTVNKQWYGNAGTGSFLYG